MAVTKKRKTKKKTTKKRGKKVSAVQQETSKEISTATELSAWGDAPSISSQDILISKILLMQGLSQLVSDEEALMGEFRDSVTKDYLGKAGSEPIEAVPFHMEKSWVTVTAEGNEFRGITPYVEGQEKPRTEELDGEDVNNYYTLTFYVLLKKDLENFDKTGVKPMPCAVSFKSKSLRAGKALATQMYVRNRGANLTPAGVICNFDAKKTKNDKGTFYVFDITPGDKTKDEWQLVALDWLKTIKAGATKTDTSDFGVETSGEMKDVETNF